MKTHHYLRIAILSSLILLFTSNILISSTKSLQNSNITIPNSSVNLDFENIGLNVTRETTLGKYGIVSIEDTIVISNNGINPVSSLHFCFDTIYKENLAYISVKNEFLSSLSVQKSSNNLNQYDNYIIYLNEPVLPKQDKTIYVNQKLIDLLNASGSVSQLWKIDLPIIPILPYTINNLDGIIKFPADATEITTVPELEVAEQIATYTRTNLDPFSRDNIEIEYTYNTNPILEFTSISRDIIVDSWGILNVKEIHNVTNTGEIPVSTYQFSIPKDASELILYDKIGTISGVALSASVNVDGKTKNVTINLKDNRSQLKGKSSVLYTMEYYLVLDDYFSKSLSQSGVKMDIYLINSEILIRSETNNIYLKSGISASSDFNIPNGQDYGDNSLILTYQSYNIINSESKYVFISYKEDGFQLISRAFIFSIIILAILSVYVVFRTRSRESESDVEFREDVLPKNEIREFTSLYDEIIALRVEINELEDNIKRKKIPKKQGAKERKNIQKRIKEAQESIEPFKKYLLDSGGTIADVIKKLDLREAEYISNEDSLKLHESNYRRGKLPSKAAYTKLKQDMIKNGEKIQKNIDKLINQLKAYLL